MALNWLSKLLGTHTGSWGTPELGVTEWLAGKNTPRTYQGGSSLTAPKTTEGAVKTFLGPNFRTAEQIKASIQSPSPTPPGSTPSVSGSVLGMASTSDGSDFTTESYDPYAALRAEISSGWDSYITSLDNQLNSLSGQRTAQEGIVGEQANRALSSVGLQKTQGMQELGTQRTRVEQNQTKNLRDLAANITNAMRAGNIYLGARGAGDSSAASQYAYALSKAGTRERSNVMQNTADILNEIGGRETNLNNLYNSEVNRIDSEKNTNLQNVALWYNQAVQQVQQQKAQGMLGKSQDLANLSRNILTQAIARLQTIQRAAITQRQALDTWAINNSNTISQLKQNMQNVASISPTLPTIGKIAGIQGVLGLNAIDPTYYGRYSSDELEKRRSQ
jgi:hypothetical protein